MAYPNPIKTTGALSQYTDVFEYFKGALLDLANNPESWPYWEVYPNRDYFIQSFFAPHSGTANIISFPMTRQQFYNWIDYWTVTTSSTDSWVNNTHNIFRTIHGTRLYQFAEPQGNANWPIEAVTDWGKIKTLELAIFVSVGNGGSLTTNSVFTSGSIVSRVPQFETCSLSYLRYALTRFNSYGSCHPSSVQGPAIGYIGELPGNREMMFDLPTGVLVGDCEVSLDGGYDYGTVIGAYGSNPYYWPVPSGNYPPNTIVMRVRKSRGAYIEPGPPIYNQLNYT